MEICVRFIKAEGDCRSRYTSVKELEQQWVSYATYRERYKTKFGFMKGQLDAH